MRAPQLLFRTPITVRRRTGEGAYGPAAADDETVYGWVVQDRRHRRNTKADRSRVDLEIRLPVSTPITVGDTIVYDGDTLVVRKVAKPRAGTDITHLEVAAGQGAA